MMFVTNSPEKNGDALTVAVFPVSTSCILKKRQDDDSRNLQLPFKSKISRLNGSEYATFPTTLIPLQLLLQLFF